MGNAKIVGIHGGRNIASDRHIKPLPDVLIKLRELAKISLKDSLRKLFDNADDALFAMADKSGSNGDQAIFFDAMRELRLQKRKVATHLIRSLVQSFNEVGQTPSQDAPTELKDTFEDITLIQHDELELNVTIEGMASRLKNSVGKQFDDLHTRIASIMLPTEVREIQIPLNPAVICQSFATACEDLNIELKARLVIFKLFEKYVLSEIPSIYVEANKLLIQHGILPDLKKAKFKTRSDELRNPQTIQGSNSNITETASPGSLFDEPVFKPAEAGHIPVLDSQQCIDKGQFETIRSLMHMNDIEDLPIGSHNSFKTISQNDILVALSNLQNNPETAIDGNIVAENNASKKFDFKRLLDNKVGNKDNSKSYSDLDTDVINLVSMLFDFILDDRQLQPTMKALISRLQIPILKVAILDKNFFDRGGHPARKLLNKIASAGLGWNEPAKGKPDRLKDKIEALVSKILIDFDNNISLFEELLADFISFTDLEARRGQLVEQRTKDSERGKAAANIAKQIVEKNLNLQLKHKQSDQQKIPKIVIQILSEAWSRVMILQHLKYGEESDEWNSSLDLVKDLIRTVTPDTFDFQAREKTLNLVPSVMIRLREGLKQISFDDFKAKAFFSELEEAHVNIISMFKRVEVKEETVPSVELDNSFTADFLNDTDDITAEFEHLKQISNQRFESKNDDANELSDQPKLGPREINSDVVSNNNQLDIVGNTPHKNMHEEIILTSLDSSTNESEVEIELDVNDPFIQQVNRFSVGCWFEFSNGDKPERCKLAAIIKATGKYIFVNRSGVKIAEKTKMGLAIELRRGSIQILNDGLLFDRALESVIGSLRGKPSS